MKLRVAIFDFKGGDQKQAGALSGYLYSELSRTGRYVLVERSRLEEIMKEKKLSLSGITSGDYSVVGEFEGVDCAVVGEIVREDSPAGSAHYIVAGRLVDVSTSKVLLSATAEGDGLERIASSLAGRLLLPSFYGPVKKTGEDFLIFELRKGDRPMLGQKVSVLKISSEIRDESTGKLIGVEWERLCDGEVSEVSSAGSTAGVLVKVSLGADASEDVLQAIKNGADKVFVFSR